MKRDFFVLLILCSLYTMPSSAQIKVTTQYKDKDVIFDASSNLYGTHTLVLKFDELSGYSASMEDTKINIRYGVNSSIFKLTSDQTNPNPNFRFSYTYYLGKYNVKPDSEYPYLIPAISGRILFITHFDNLNYVLGKQNTDSIVGIVFYYKGTDTVCASRSGEVVQIDYSEKNSKEPNQGITYYDKPSRNIIAVEQADGTITRYICVSPAVILPKEGDRIIAGQPIAVFTKDEDRNRMGLYLSYLDKNLKYKAILPKFYTQEGLILLNFGGKYQSISTIEIIEKELTRKEKKNLIK